MDKEILGSVTLDAETSNRNASFSRRMQKYYEALKGGKTQREGSDTQERENKVQS